MAHGHGHSEEPEARTAGAGGKEATGKPYIGDGLGAKRRSLTAADGALDKRPYTTGAMVKPYQAYGTRTRQIYSAHSGT